MGSVRFVLVTSWLDVVLIRVLIRVSRLVGGRLGGMGVRNLTIVMFGWICSLLWG